MSAANEWRPPDHLSQDQFHDAPFELSPEKDAYYTAAAAADEHKQKMAGMSVAARHEYIRGLREGLNDTVPKPGDFDNPLRKDQPKEPKAPRATGPGSRNHMVTVRRLGVLARKAKGRRR